MPQDWAAIVPPEGTSWARSVRVLNAFVDIDRSECFNESPVHGWGGILVASNNPYLESNEGDPALLVSLVFKQPVRLVGIRLVAPPGGYGPKDVKIYVNARDISIDSVTAFSPALSVQWAEEQLRPDSFHYVTLEGAKFARATSLALFVESNQDGFPTTIIEYLQLVGMPL